MRKYLYPLLILSLLGLIFGSLLLAFQVKTLDNQPRVIKDPKVIFKTTSEATKITDDSGYLSMTIPKGWQFSTKGIFDKGKKIGNRIVTASNLPKYNWSLTQGTQVEFVDGLSVVDIQISRNPVYVFELSNCLDREITETKNIFGVTAQTTKHSLCGDNGDGYIYQHQGTLKALTDGNVIDVNFVIVVQFANKKIHKIVQTTANSAEMTFLKN